MSNKLDFLDDAVDVSYTINSYISDLMKAFSKDDIKLDSDDIAAHVLAFLSGKYLVHDAFESHPYKITELVTVYNIVLYSIVFKKIYSSCVTLDIFYYNIPDMGILVVCKDDTLDSIIGRLQNAGLIYEEDVTELSELYNSLAGTEPIIYSYKGTNNG